ncbi:hypothetical protein LSTR_LSTR015044, partial [Laodelphax striatellus]
MNSKEFIFEFIENYRQHTLLWDTCDPNYTNKTRRNNAYCDMAKKQNITVKQVKAKIKNLRSYYSRERQKMRSKKSGLGADKCHTPWFAHSALQFIGDSLTPRSTRDSMEERNQESVM